MASTLLRDYSYTILPYGPTLDSDEPSFLSINNCWVQEDKSQIMHIVHTETAPGFGGQQIRVLTEAAGMIRRGHQVTLLCPDEGSVCANVT